MHSDEILKRAEEGMKESNKVLIKELVHDLEEKGISPVISVDGEVKKLKKFEALSESEKKDFEKELEKFGFEKSDFCLLEENTDEQISLPTNLILVHKKSAKIRKYKVGNGTHWISDFHHDLQNKIFN
jgi:hypothetical protein